MKIIGNEQYGVLYDKLYEYLTSGGDFSGVGIEEKSTRGVLELMWKLKKEWEVLTILICYHYSRKDSAIIRFGEMSVSLRQGASFPEICRTLQIKPPKDIPDMIIGRAEFEEEYGVIDSILPVKSSIKIGEIIGGLGIESNDRPLFCRAWKEGKRWEVVVMIIVFLKTRLFTVVVETGKGTFKFKKGVDPFQIQEELEN